MAADEYVVRLRYAGGSAFEARAEGLEPVVMEYGEGRRHMSPMQLVLAALAGCTAIDVLTILRKMRMEVEGLEIEVRGLRRDEHPRIYRKVVIRYRVFGEGLDKDRVTRAVELSLGKYCSVGAMVRLAGAEIDYELEVISGSGRA